MISRRDFLQVAAAAAAVTGLGGRLGRAVGAGRVRQEDLLRFAAEGPAHAAAHGRLPCAAEAALLSRALAQSGRRRGARAAAASRRARIFLPRSAFLPSSLDAYMLTLGRLRGAGQDLWPRRRHGSHRHARQRHSRRARLRARAAARRRRQRCRAPTRRCNRSGADMIAVMQALGVEATTGHWEFTLGGERVAELFGDIDQAGLLRHTFPRRQCPRHRFRGAGFPFHPLVREGWRQRRRDRPGVSRIRPSPIRAG